jgi:phosphatidylethanolamine/phosphatidyl-N-methylethanolamine N-methyltransferase
MANTNKLRDGLRFFGKFLRNPNQVGSVMPSSRYLAEAMAADLDLERGDLVIEYGPGTGPMTAALADTLPAGVHYLGIERDQHFQELLEERFPHMDFHHGSVVDVAEILETRGLPKAKVIISGLPFASLPKDVQNRIAHATREALAEDGEFRLFQYVHAYGLPGARRFRKVMTTLFGSCTRSQPVLRNVPPAYVLTYRP